MAPLICPICRQSWDDSFTWYVCDHCGNRCCPHCMGSGKQKGPYGVDTLKGTVIFGEGSNEVSYPVELHLENQLIID